MLCQRYEALKAHQDVYKRQLLGGDKPWCYSHKTQVSKRAMAHLHLEGYSDADFRTTFGTQMKEYGKTSAEVADLMGHADTRMVERVYACLLYTSP